MSARHVRTQDHQMTQDSGNDDAMVATLVVMLPSVYLGGDLVVRHQGVSQAYLGSRATVRVVAFCAGCRREVRPVKFGHRITLSYNLLLHGPSATPAGAGDSVLSAAARLLADHFTQPRARWCRPGEDPPARRLAMGAVGGHRVSGPEPHPHSQAWWGSLASRATPGIRPRRAHSAWISGGRLRASMISPLIETYQAVGCDAIREGRKN